LLIAAEGNDCFIFMNCIENFVFYKRLQQFGEINCSLAISMSKHWC